MKISTFVYYWGPVFLYAAIIFYMSSLSFSTSDGGFVLNDKLLHSVEYFIFAFLLYRAGRQSNWGKYTFLLTYVLTILYSLSDEVHQYFVPGRVMDGYDLLFNAFGGAIFLLLIEIKKKLIR